MIKPIVVLRYAIAYISWILSFLLWLWFMIISRTALLGYLGTYYIQDIFNRKMIVQGIDRFYMLGLGIFWVIIMIVIESYFRNGAEKGDLPKRLGIVFSLEIGLVFLADIALGYLNGFEVLPSSRWIIFGVELALTIGCILLAVKNPKLSPLPQNPKIV